MKGLYTVAIVFFFGMSNIVTAQTQYWKWAKSNGGSVYDFAQSISPDTNGNVYVTGGYASNVTFGSYTLTNEGVFVVKYDSTGNVIWAKS